MNLVPQLQKAYLAHWQPVPIQDAIAVNFNARDHLRRGRWRT